MTALFVFIAVVVLLLLYFVSIHNSLVKNRNLVEEAWSVINVLLKKRYELIPNLVETVKGYAKHEKETLENVINARNQSENASDLQGKQIAENKLTQAITNLFALVENYPDLKANTNFLAFQTELSNLETDIEKARRYYNGTVRQYNTKIEIFPNNSFAAIYNFKKADFFELDDTAEKQVPKVNF